MKYGKKAGTKSSAKESADAAPAFVVIPFPSGLSAVIAKEARRVPEFTPREVQAAAWVA